MRSAGTTHTEQRLLVDLIVHARALTGWTQQRLAEEARVSIGTVRKLCSGDSPEPGFFIVRRVVAALLDAVGDVNAAESERLRGEYLRLALGAEGTAYTNVNHTGLSPAGPPPRA